jgi:hypothetical protein
MCRFLRLGFWSAVTGSLTLIVFGGLTGCFPALVVGLVLAWVALAMFGAACLSAPSGQGKVPSTLVRAGRRLRRTDTGLLVRVDGLKVTAVFVLGREVLACLDGGEGYRSNAKGGLREGWPEGKPIFLTWHGQGGCSVAKLVERLKTWQAAGTTLCLLGAKGCSSLVQDDRHWVDIPELVIVP